MPFSIHQNVDHPLSLYAASKKANELMAHTYSHLYGLPTTGLRFFTVYGPWGRPDMALFKFTKAILADQPIQVFNFGNHRRDFTYVDDIVEGIVRVLDRPAPPIRIGTASNPIPEPARHPGACTTSATTSRSSSPTTSPPSRRALGKKAKMELLPLQAGDVPDTFADVDDLVEQFGYRPSTTVEEGIARFVTWYREYFKT
jgi:UDP-glucuronate 4-epimerase